MKEEHEKGELACWLNLNVQILQTRCDWSTEIKILDICTLNLVIACLGWLENRNILPCRSLLTISLLDLPAHYSLVLKLISSFSEEEHGYKAAAHWVNMQHIKIKFPQ